MTAHDDLLTELAEIQHELFTRCTDAETVRLRSRKRGIEYQLYPEDHQGVPWCRAWWWLPGMGGRCTASLERSEVGRWGRCELRPHPRAVDHALELGVHPLRWRTDLVG